MADYIDRQAAIDAICKACSMEEDYHKCDGYPKTSTWCYKLVALRALPSADVVPVRHGRWIPKFDGKFQGGAYWFDCSECGHTVAGGNLSGKHFCENCGARMDGEQDE